MDVPTQPSPFTSPPPPPRIHNVKRNDRHHGTLSVTSQTTATASTTMLVSWLCSFVSRPAQWLSLTIRRRVPQLAEHATLLVITATLLIDQLCMMLIVPVLPLHMIAQESEQAKKAPALRTRWNLDWMNVEERTAFVIAVKGAVQVLASTLLTAALTKRYGYKRMLLCGLLGMLCSCELFAYGESIWVFLFARAVQGVSSSLVNAAGLSLLATKYPDETRRDSAMGVAMCGMCVGYAAGPTAASVFYNIGGKSMPFHLSALLLAAVIAVIYTFTSHRTLVDKQTVQRQTSLKRVDVNRNEYQIEQDLNNNQAEDEDEDQSQSSAAVSLLVLVRDPYIGLCLLDIIISCLPVSVLEAVLTMHLSQHVADTTDVTTGTVWLPSSVAMLAATYVTTLVMTKRPNAQPAIIQIALLLECLACVMLPHSVSIAGVSVWLAVLMFGDVQVETAVVPLISTIIDRRYGASGHYGSGYALWDMAYSAVETIGPLVGGFSVARVGFANFMLLVCLIMLIAVPLNRRLHVLMQKAHHDQQVKMAEGTNHYYVPAEAGDSLIEPEDDDDNRPLMHDHNGSSGGEGL